MAVTLEPLRAPATVSAGVGSSGVESDRCLRIQTDSEVPAGTELAPPLRIGEVALDPAPLSVATPEELSHVECEAHERTLDVGCLDLLDDRMIVRSSEAPLLWILRANELVVIEPAQPAQRLVVRGLLPETVQRIDAEAIDTFGRSHRSELVVTTPAPLTHVVINEVLANAIGPEPEQEWVELFNDGATAVDLAGYSLEDIGGQTPIPAYSIQPGEFVLLVNEAFDERYGYDVPVSEAVVLLRVSRLGKNGLSNSGEPLRLRDASGAVVSQFPAASNAKAGVSLARRVPWALDDDPESFGQHAAAGASPGAPNVL
jgi:hypothetical protein